MNCIEIERKEAESIVFRCGQKILIFSFFKGQTSDKFYIILRGAVFVLIQKGMVELKEKSPVLKFETQSSKELVKSCLPSLFEPKQSIVDLIFII